MPSILCKCGYKIGLGEIPNPNEWRIISDVEYDKYSGNIDAEELYADTKAMLVCSQCERVLVFWNGFQSEPTSYTKEN